MDQWIILHTNHFELSLYQLLCAVGILFASTLLILFSSRFIKRYGSHHQLSTQFIRFVKTGIRVLFYLLTLAALLEVLQVNYHKLFAYNIIETDKYRVTVLNLIAAFIIIYLTRVFVYAAEYWMDRRISNKKMDRGRGKSFIQILKYLIWILGVSIIASTFGINMTFVIASISALLIGVGFGLQHIFNDFFSGIIILFDGSVKVDDIVEVDDTVGRVLGIGLRFSKVLTRDNVVIIVPNSRFTTEKVINWTHNNEETRFHINIGVAYGSDVRLVERILLKAAAEHDQIVKMPKSFVRFNDFGESSLDFQLYFWTVNDFQVENIKSDLRFVIDDEFRKNKVEIPFPQRDIHLKSKNFD